MSSIGESEAGTVTSTCYCLLRAGCYGASPTRRAINKYDALRLLFNSVRFEQGLWNFEHVQSYLEPYLR